MGILLGLLSALSFGTADYAAGLSSRKIGAYATLFYVQLLGLLFLSVAMLILGEWYVLTSLRHVALASLWMAIDLVGILMLYQGLRVGKASVVAPIASSFSIITILLAVLFGERPAWQVVIGMAVTIIGVILTTLVLTSNQQTASEKKIAKGALWAILAALFLGSAFFGLRYPVEAIGGVPTVWIGRLQSCLIIPLLLFCFKLKLVKPSQKQVGLLIIPGLLDALALVCYNLGLLLEQTAIVITATSLFAVITLLWGLILGKERLVWNQWVGVCMTFLGILLVSVN